MEYRERQDPLGALDVLDVGCGAGIFSEGLARLGVNSVTGIDPTPKCIELASAHLETQDDIKSKVTYKNMTVEDLNDTEDKRFDLVCCSEVIEHVHDQKKFL